MQPPARLPDTSPWISHRDLIRGVSKTQFLIFFPYLSHCQPSLISTQFLSDLESPMVLPFLPRPLSIRHRARTFSSSASHRSSGPLFSLLCLRLHTPSLLSWTLLPGAPRAGAVSSGPAPPHPDLSHLLLRSHLSLLKTLQWGPVAVRKKCKPLLRPPGPSLPWMLRTQTFWFLAVL